MIMQAQCDSTEVSSFLTIGRSTLRGESAVSAVETTAEGRTVYEVIKAILRYDVRSIGDPDQAWYWTQDWQNREQEAEEDLAAGRTLVFLTGDDLLSHLDGCDIGLE